MFSAIDRLRHTLQDISSRYGVQDVHVQHLQRELEHLEARESQFNQDSAPVTQAPEFNTRAKALYRDRP